MLRGAVTMQQAIGSHPARGKRAQSGALICKACVFAFGTVLALALAPPQPFRYALARAMNAPRSSIIDRTEFGPPPPVQLGVKGSTPAVRAITTLAVTTAEEMGRYSDCETPVTPAHRPSHAEPRISLRKRLAVLFAALAVPAMAAPGGFGTLAADSPDQSVTAQAAMPFERPGMSFPGSAFYYLADPPSQALITLPSSDPLNAGAEGTREIGQAIDAGPSARPIFAAGSGIGHARAVQCLAQAVWYEAASESEGGQRAVAQVVLNRVAHPGWPGSVCGVVYQGSERSTGCQFSFTCDGSLARRATGPTWARAQRIAQEALSGEVYAPIGHATHYHTLWVNPYWAGTLDLVGTIGAHRFYRNRGRGGEKDAFTTRYSGTEPVVKVGIGSNAAATAGGLRDVFASFLPDVAHGSASGALSAERSATPAVGVRDATTRSGTAAPPAASIASPFGENLADPALRSAGQAREEYVKAGQWKRDPTGLNLKAGSALEKPPEK